ncbi:hypothetical protein ACFYZ8_34025 [Streptomyces sp. NPDC001668]|uniref:hypothetical protein n=1 Tax=Streptomyces sp. NPDC001668 TaxID=3364598 RepID=UPI0036A9AB8C
MTPNQAEATKTVDDVLAGIDKTLEEADSRASKADEPSEAVPWEPEEALESPVAADEVPSGPEGPEDAPLAPAAPQTAPTPAPRKPREDDWWDSVYYDDKAHWDTNTGNISDDPPSAGPVSQVPPEPVLAPTPAADSDVEKVDDDNYDDGDHEGDQGVVDADQAPDDEGAIARAWRQAKALQSLARVEGRRRAALLYLPGTALAWGLGWHRRVIAFMEAGYVAPGQLIGSLIGLTALGGGLWLAVRKKSPLLAAAAFVVAGVGYAEGGTHVVDYMTAHGWDPAIATPMGSALLTGALTWWFIDRRTAHWFPPLACAMRTPTAAIGLALIFYTAPIV